MQDPSPIKMLLNKESFQYPSLESKKQVLNLNVQLKVILVMLCALICIQPAHTYMINLDSGNENECFHERVPVGVKLGFSFEVIEGGFNDVDIQIKDPTGAIVHQDERSSHGKVTIEANLDGPYHFCFSNAKSSQAPKMVIFDIDRSDSTPKSIGPESDKDEETKKIVGMVESLLMATISSRHDVRYLTARDRVHRKINEATNSKIVWWSGIEFLLLLSVTLGQVWYLKRFFEIRRSA